MALRAACGLSRNTRRAWDQGASSRAPLASGVRKLAVKSRWRAAGHTVQGTRCACRCRRPRRERGQIHTDTPQFSPMDYTRGEGGRVAVRKQALSYFLFFLPPRFLPRRLPAPAPLFPRAHAPQQWLNEMSPRRRRRRKLSTAEASRRRGSAATSTAAAATAYSVQSTIHSAWAATLSSLRNSSSACWRKCARSTWPRRTASVAFSPARAHAFATSGPNAARKGARCGSRADCARARCGATVGATCSPYADATASHPSPAYLAAEDASAVTCAWAEATRGALIGDGHPRETQTRRRRRAPAGLGRRTA